MTTTERLAQAHLEAVLALADRARRAGVPDPDEFAKEFLDALHRQGWRAYAPVTALPAPPRHPVPPPTDELAALRERMGWKPRGEAS